MKSRGVKINLLNGDAERKARRTTLVAAGLFTLFVGLLAAVGGGASFRAATHGTSVLSEVGNMLALTDIRNVVLGGSANAANDPFATPDNRLNILILGIGGSGHAGSQLTDTIIIASIDRTTKKVGLVSIPRDLAYPLGGGRFMKINAVNAYAEQAHPGQGAAETATDFSKLLGVRIDRVLKIDFKGFEDFVDTLGGVDIDVQNTFTDYQFPTDDNGPNPDQWTVVSFKKGLQHMDGHTALQFARSRHGNNGEGSDFARSARQQLVIEAVRSKLLSLGTLSNPKKITDLWTAISSHVQTDLTAWDLVKFAPLALDYAKTDITTRVLTDGPDGELVDTSVEGAFMLFPRKPDWSEIRAAVADPFETKAQIEAKNHPQQQVAVEIRNGTTRTGFASQVSQKLKDLGYTVTAIGNAAHRGYEKTVIYDLTGGAKPDELARLRSLIDANVSSAPPGPSVLTDQGSEPVAATSSQFLVILGGSSLSFVDPYYAGTPSP